MDKKDEQGKRGHILIIDDESDFLYAIQAWMEAKGFMVSAAENGKVGVEMFKKVKPDLCFIDILMPEMDGVETLKELKRIKTDIRVIITSGYSEYEISERFVGYDVAGFIQKPYHFEEFSASLQGVLTASRGDHR